MKLEELKINKQDISSAVTLDDVGTAVSREIDHADRRADNLIKSIAGETTWQICTLLGSFFSQPDLSLVSLINALIPCGCLNDPSHGEPSGGSERNQGQQV